MTEHYEVQRRRGDVGGTYLVGIQGEQAFTITARCHNQHDADTVAAALNSQGAVQERDRLQRALELAIPSTGMRKHFLARADEELARPTTGGQ